MNPRGILAYLIGTAALVLTGLLTGFVLVFAFVVPVRPGQEAPLWLLLGCAMLAFAALQVVAAGLYRMLVHLYHTISRTDPVGDRRLRGRTWYVFGQIATAMTALPAGFFMLVAIHNGVRGDQQLNVASVFGALPTGLAFSVALIAWLAGLGLMVRDLFLRNEEIVAKRDAERRRRFDEADEPHTEILPMPGLPVEEWRKHVREDR